MNERQRLEAFKQAMSAAGEQYGVRIAIVQQIDNVVLDEPALGFVLMAEHPMGEEDTQTETTVE